MWTPPTVNQRSCVVRFNVVGRRWQRQGKSNGRSEVSLTKFERIGHTENTTWVTIQPNRHCVTNEGIIRSVPSSFLWHFNPPHSNTFFLSQSPLNIPHNKISPTVKNVQRNCDSPLCLGSIPLRSSHNRLPTPESQPRPRPGKRRISLLN